MSVRLARAATALAAIASLAVAACGGGDAVVDRPTVTGAWARPSPAGAADGVVYFELRVPSDDTLVRVAVDPSVAASASLHATTGGPGGTPHHGGGGDAGVTTTAVSGVVGMEVLEAVAVEAGEPLVFAPGGNHVMLERLAGPLVDGARFDLTITLASGATVVAPVVVTANPPG